MPTVYLMRVTTWLDLAKSAASGGNSQPWTAAYTERGQTIAIQLAIDPNYRSHPSAMDMDGSASVIALGCLTANLCAIAAWDGYDLSERRIDEKASLWDSSILLIFTPAAKLVPAYSPQDIRDRHTNRYPYAKAPVGPDLISALLRIGRRFPDIRLLEFAEKKNSLIPGLVALESLRWSNETFLKHLFNEVSFPKDGTSPNERIEADQLGISRLEQWMLRLIRDSRLLQRLLTYGVDRVLSQKSLGKNLRNSDRIYFLQANNNSFKSYFDLGQCFQEQWLETNKQGYGFQPIGTPLIAYGYWQSPASGFLRPKEKALVETLTSEFQTRFDIDFKRLVVGFRVGVPKRHSKQSSRKPIVTREMPSLLSPPDTNANYADSFSGR